MTAPLWIAACFGIFIIGGLIGFAISTWMIMAGEDREVRGLNNTLRAANDHIDIIESRINRALEQETAGANATVKRMARILRGEV